MLLSNINNNETMFILKILLSTVLGVIADKIRQEKKKYTEKDGKQIIFACRLHIC